MFLSFSSSWFFGTPLILFKGRNVAIPSFCDFKYFMQSEAALSSSTTMLFILLPAAISRASEYFELTFPRSETVPLALNLLFCSRILLTALEAPKASVMLMFLALSLDNSSILSWSLPLAVLSCEANDESSSSFLPRSSTSFLKVSFLCFSFSISSLCSFSTAFTLFMASSILSNCTSILSFSLKSSCCCSLSFCI